MEDRVLRILRGRKKISEGFSSDTQAEFLCKCGKQKAWIYDGQEVLPCPECGRKYRGVYDRKKYTIKAVEIK